jgi:archaellum biogenesis ATPase FlaH
LTNLFHRCHDGGAQPAVNLLQDTLILILEAFDDVYIVLDALDECAERKDLLKWIREITLMRKVKLHLLVTSRLEEDIAMHLRSLNTDHVYMDSEHVTGDIARYIDSILKEENQWSNDTKVIIKSTLLERARGMYVRSDVPISLQFDRCSLIKVSICFVADRQTARMP